MLAFILRRLGQALLVMLAVGLIAFALFRFVGDPVLFMLGQDATPEDRERDHADARPRPAVLRAVREFRRRARCRASSG